MTVALCRLFLDLIGQMMVLMFFDTCQSAIKILRGHPPFLAYCYKAVDVRMVCDLF